MVKKNGHSLLRGCLDGFFCHSISITHHFKIPHLFGTITQYFSHYLWVLYPSHGAGFFFFFNLFSITEPNEKKKKNRTSKRKKKKKKKKRTESNSQPLRRKEKKKSKVVKRCGWYCLWVLYVCLITILPLSYKLWKLKTAKMCFQFP